jgi:hypothetical protein
VRDDERCDDEWMVRMSVGLGFEKIYYILMLLHVLSWQTIAKLLGSLDPLFSIFH